MKQSLPDCVMTCARYRFLFAVLLLPFLAAAAFAEGYLIGTGDVLSITVYDHDELKTKVRVTESGKIEFPLIGSVEVGGLKTSAAAKKIEELLADGYIVNPQVQVYIEEFKSKKAVVLGAVNNPGLIELHGPTTLLELISQAGGLQKDAGETATIKREADGQEKNIAVDLQKLLESSDDKSNVEILGGDTVSIAKASVCYISGQVNKPGAYPCSRSTTVRKMVSLAGSFTDIASESGITINRVGKNGKKKVLKDVDLDTPVLPDDVIEVSESLF